MHTSARHRARQAARVAVAAPVKPARGRHRRTRRAPVGAIPPVVPARRIVAVIPAHNEESSIAATLASLRRQPRRPDRIVVVADNCTDATAAIAAANGASVFATHANAHRKAGALNQALAGLLPQLRADDMVLVMDADTELDDDFVARACAALRGRVGAVGGIFLGRQGGGVLEQLQRNEYARYAREIHRRGDVAKVLTGTATLFRAGVLREVAVERGHRLPGRPGDFYDASALTEDNEITLALKTLGYACISPAGCTVRTELMPTWADLWRQRKRWQRGAVDNLRAYGFTRVTAPYIVKQVLVGAGVMAFALYLAMTVLTLAVAHTMSPSPVWTSIGGLFVAERCWTVRREGWRGVALALALLPEMAFDVVLQAVWVASVVAAARRSEARWHHVPAPTRRIACTTA